MDAGELAIALASSIRRQSRQRGRGVEVDAGELGAAAQVEGDVGRW
ncbi:hypothetical protein [Sorangium sp. So ce1389]